jgi:DNA-binding NarL/FixJ family response regulator
VTKILIAGGRTLCRAALRALLVSSNEIAVVGEAARAGRAAATATRLKPDVVLLDLAVDESAVIKAISQIRQAFPAIRVLVLCAEPSQQTMFECLQAGANGVLTQDLSLSDLFAAIRTVMSTGAYLSPSLSGLAVDDYVRRAQDKHVTSELDLLTEREREVLSSIADGMSGPEVARAMGLSPRTADSHRQNIMRKLGIRTVAGLTKFAIRHGLSSLDDPHRGLDKTGSAQ